MRKVNLKIYQTSSKRGPAKAVPLNHEHIADKLIHFLGNQRGPHRRFC